MNAPWEIARELQNLPQALKAFRDSRASLERLAKADPSNTRWQRDLSYLLECIVDILNVQGMH